MPRFKGFIDDSYERKLPINSRNMNTFENKEVFSSTIVVWKCEDRSLPKFDLTCLTKSLIMLHQEENEINRIGLNHRREACQILNATAESLFGSFVRTINVADLKESAAQKREFYIKNVSSQHPEIAEHPRILESYSLAHSAFLLWLKLHEWTLDGIEEKVDQYITEVCLPWLMDRIESEKGKEIGRTSSLLSNTDYGIQLGSLIRSLTLKQFLTHVTFSNQKETSHVHLAKSLWKLAKDPKWKGSQILFKDIEPKQVLQLCTE
jgi:hypothetical protein